MFQNFWNIQSLGLKISRNFRRNIDETFGAATLPVWWRPRYDQFPWDETPRMQAPKMKPTILYIIIMNCGN